MTFKELMRIQEEMLDYVVKNNKKKESKQNVHNGFKSVFRGGNQVELQLVK